MRHLHYMYRCCNCHQLSAPALCPGFVSHGFRLGIVGDGFKANVGQGFEKLAGGLLWPSLFLPQQRASPSILSAQV
jgi:hypothetical protein